MKIAQKKKNLIQHNYLIQARFNCSFLEYSIIVHLIAQIDSRSDTELSIYQIPVGLITDIDSGSSYENVRNACERLLEKTIIIEKIPLETSPRQEFIGFPIMQTCEYKKGTGYVLAQFNPALKPYLLNLTKNFTKAEVDAVLGMDTFYSGRLYLLFKQYVAIGKRSLSMDEVRDMFNLRETKEMAKYKNINKYILKPAEQELLKTNLVVKRIDSQTILNGKTVERVMYSINKNDDEVTTATRLDYVIESPLNEEWEKKLYNIGFKLPAIREVAKVVAKGDIDAGYINFVINKLTAKELNGKIIDLCCACYDAIMIKRYLWEEYKQPKPIQTKLTNHKVKASGVAVGDELIMAHPLFPLLKKCGLNDWQIRDLTKRIPVDSKKLGNASAYVKNDANGSTPEKYANSCYHVLLSQFCGL